MLRLGLKCIILSGLFVTLILLSILGTKHKKDSYVFDILPFKQESIYHRRLYGNVELTIRMPASEKMVKRLYCIVLRSAAMFWNPRYGDIVIILDQADSKSSYFPKNVSSLPLPFRFRFVYEEPPKNVHAFNQVARRISKSYGYVVQLYSSFLMDLYTDKPIIAWTDTDAVFTIPVTDESIMKNGTLVVKGMNNFHLSWLTNWDRVNRVALGVPMISDFMSYFPAYLHSHTIRNCRNYIMKRFKVDTFEEAFIKIAIDHISPVSIILTYAYHFERDSYQWHIDIGSESITSYSKIHAANHYLAESDLLPELHTTVHISYHKYKVHPLEEAICYTQINMNVKGLPHCKLFYNKPNMQPFEFANNPLASHVNTWCKGEGRVNCRNIIKRRYKSAVELYRNHHMTFETKYIKVIEDYALSNYNMKCPFVNYTEFSSSTFFKSNRESDHNSSVNLNN